MHAQDAASTDATESRRTRAAVPMLAFEPQDGNTTEIEPTIPSSTGVRMVGSRPSCVA